MRIRSIFLYIVVTLVIIYPPVLFLLILFFVIAAFVASGDMDKNLGGKTK